MPRRGPVWLAGLRAIVALMLREMSTRYGRSPGGYIWAIVEPLGALLVMAFAFSLLLRAPSLGNSFLLYYASGYLPFLVYAQVQAAVQTALRFSRPLLMYPAVSWIDAILARFFLNVLTSVLVMGIVFAAMIEVTGATAVLSYGPMIWATCLSAVLGLALGTLNAVLVGLYPAWGNIWSIASRPLFLIAGVIFIYEDLPRTVQDYLWYLPWIHITGLFRTGVYPTYEPQYISLTLVMVWVLVPLALGLVLMRRFRQDILTR
ncbi:ABC transporter permease [Roseicyclus elongatus]|nr:ABC transporter permease [Roseibacterium elongatum]